MGRKGDIEIGFRAYEEIKRIAPPFGITQIARKFKICSNAPKGWESGACPSAKSLQSLCYCGADIVYILTGRRSKNENN